MMRTSLLWIYKRFLRRTFKPFKVQSQELARDNSLLSVSINNCENGLLPNFYNVIRNQREIQETHGEEHGGVEEQQGPPSHMEAQSNLTSSPSLPRSPGAA
jgi:hypothetical protein